MGKHIVGRKEEVQLLQNIVRGILPYSVVNIYGPGGIGKTEVFKKFQAYCSTNGIPYAHMDDPTLTVDQVLEQLRYGLVTNIPGIVSNRAFRDFNKKLKQHLTITKVIAQGGGVDKMFDVAGNLLDFVPVKALVHAARGVYGEIKAILDHRDALERYRRGANQWLTENFVEAVEKLAKDSRLKTVLLIDAYEQMTSLDDWMCESFVKALCGKVIIVILGRNKLSRDNSDWREFDANDLCYHELQELSEAEAKNYLRYYGLSDEATLDGIYQFTGGYPLCLSLATELATEQGWEAVKALDPANRDRVATQLLERILQQEKVKPVREFLERGVVTLWFDPEAISYILEIDLDSARAIYDQIGKFSFTLPHPNGLRFHDKVRDLLLDRLKFIDGGKKYRQLAQRASEFYAMRAGIALDSP